MTGKKQTLAIVILSIAHLTALAPAGAATQGSKMIRNWKDFEIFACVRRHVKALCGCEPIARIEWRNMASCAAPTNEDLLAARRKRITWIRVRRWLQRIEVERQGEKLLVAITASNGDGIGRINPRCRGNEFGRNETVIAR